MDAGRRGENAICIVCRRQPLFPDAGGAEFRGQQAIVERVAQGEAAARGRDGLAIAKDAIAILGEDRHEFAERGAFGEGFLFPELGEQEDANDDHDDADEEGREFGDRGGFAAGILGDKDEALHGEHDEKGDEENRHEESLPHAARARFARGAGGADRGLEIAGVVQIHGLADVDTAEFGAARGPKGGGLEVFGAAAAQAGVFRGEAEQRCAGAGRGIGQGSLGIAKANLVAGRKVSRINPEAVDAGGVGGAEVFEGEALRPEAHHGVPAGDAFVVDHDFVFRMPAEARLAFGEVERSRGAIGGLEEDLGHGSRAMCERARVVMERGGGRQGETGGEQG